MLFHPHSEWRVNWKDMKNIFCLFVCLFFNFLFSLSWSSSIQYCSSNIPIREGFANSQELPWSELTLSSTGRAPQVSYSNGASSDGSSKFLGSTGNELETGPFAPESKGVFTRSDISHLLPVINVDSDTALPWQKDHRVLAELCQLGLGPSVVLGQYYRQHL